MTQYTTYVFVNLISCFCVSACVWLEGVDTGPVWRVSVSRERTCDGLHQHAEAWSQAWVSSVIKHKVERILHLSVFCSGSPAVNVISFSEPLLHSFCVQLNCFESLLYSLKGLLAQLYVNMQWNAGDSVYSGIKGIFDPKIKKEIKFSIHATVVKLSL